MKKSNYHLRAIILFGVSMVLPVFINQWDFWGFQAFLAGWIAFFEFDPFLTFPWIANLIFITNLMLRGRVIKIRVTLSVITILFSLLAFNLSAPFSDNDVFNENIFGFGYLAWLSSFILLFIGQFREMREITRNPQLKGTYSKFSKSNLVGYFIFLTIIIIIGLFASYSFHTTFADWD